MQRSHIAVAGVAVLALALGALAVVASTGTEEAGPCCFTHPDYSGICMVQPGEGETCADILAYLNNPMSAGKSYCGNTRIRGGWTQVDCDTDE